MIQSRPRPRKEPHRDGFSRREREIMDALYRLGTATAAQILDEIADPPSYTAIRTQLTILERKGHVRHTSDGTRYVYEPRIAREQMGRRAIDTLLKTFYGNSVEQVVAALLEQENLAPDELDRLAQLIDKAREEGR
ncbi:MAG TPA: BlaI/MecI/CopY family transcriptional regulator [Rhizomicrobium sp.]|jgi:predicted transcriptional regulator|nr:BlaI/MecI/CopY family transcriptional regulator [Rhizomicrobium sp.]